MAAPTKDPDKAMELELRFIAARESLEKLYQSISDVGIKAFENSIESDKGAVAFQKAVSKWTHAFKGDVSDVKDPNIKAGLQLTGEASKASDKIGNDIMKIMKTGIGIIEDIHGRLKQSSPLLQSVESLFNLAVQLFFMPLGNKLATVMLPAIMDLVDDVMEMWDKIEGMDLGEMLNEMINTGAKIFGQYFNNLGESLSKQGGLLGSIGSILSAMGDFIENKLAGFLETGLRILEFIMSNLGTLATAFIEFKIASIALQAAQVTATILSSSKIASVIGGVVTLTAVEGIANGALYGSGVGQDIMNMNAASGAYVGPSEGGRTVKVGEAGVGEFILPEDRLQNIMGSVSDRMVDVAQTQPAEVLSTQEQQPQVINNYFNITGYTDRELRNIIKDTVDTQISQSRLRSGF